MKKMTVERSLAYHEAGHAILALYFDFSFKVVSIVENTHSLGRLILNEFNLPIDFEENDSTKAMLDKFIQVILGGSIAETKFTGEKSIFDADDLKKCDELIEQYYGRVPKVGNTYFEFMKALTESRFLSFECLGAPNKLISVETSRKSCTRTREV